jgi:hypothetical protein
MFSWRMPKKYEPWHDPDTEKSRPLAALSETQRLCCSAEQKLPHTTMPGSHMALQAIRKAIDDYAACQIGHREYFWGRPHSAGCRRA